MSRTHTITYDDRDTNTLHYENGWFLEGSYNATRTGETGTLSSSNWPVEASVTFNFPVPAVEFRYYGIKRSHGGRYGICVDCDPNNRIFQTIDGVNPTDDGLNPPEVLFSVHFKTPSFHEIILRNQADDRFEGGNSQITIDRFELDVPVQDSGQTVEITIQASTSSPSATSNESPDTVSTTATTQIPGSNRTITGSVLAPSSNMISQISRNSTASPSTSAPTILTPSGASSLESSFPSSSSSMFTTPTDSVAQSTKRSGAPVGVIVGATIGGGVLLLLLLGISLWFLCWKPRHLRRHKQVGDPFLSTGHDPNMLGTAHSSKRITTAPPSTAATTRFTKSPLPASTESEAGHAHTPETRPDSNANSRRELDAGPYTNGEVEGGETLPPEYEQVFRESHMEPPDTRNMIVSQNMHTPELDT